MTLSRGSFQMSLPRLFFVLHFYSCESGCHQPLAADSSHGSAAFSLCRQYKRHHLLTDEFGIGGRDRFGQFAAGHPVNAHCLMPYSDLIPSAAAGSFRISAHPDAVPALMPEADVI